MKRNLHNVTLVGVDCIAIERLILASEICQKKIEFGAIKLLTNLESNHGNIIKIPEVKSLEEYSYFMIKKVNDYVDTDHVLIIQHDGFILNPNAWNDEFLQYDYIGAPWWYTDGMNVGNGGFSLRSKKLLNILQNDSTIKNYHPEDHYICRTHRSYLEEKGIIFAPESLAQKFSKEGVRRVRKPDVINVWTDEFGFHGLDRTDISKWLKIHPEFGIKNELAERFL